jgi:transmembrane sensor
MPVSDHIADLLFRYLREELSVDEELELKRWVAEDSRNEELFNRVTSEENLFALAKEHQVVSDRIWNKITEKAPELKRTQGKRFFLRIPVSAVAAVGLTVIVSGAWYWYNHREKLVVQKDVATARDIPPGGNRAILELSSGKKIILDSARDGKLETGGGIEVMKKDSSELVYNGNGQPINEKPENIGLSTLTTPRGGQFRVTLADGTRVWLNAASSLRYPETFSGSSDRTVELSGEAYFEIAHDFKKPFRVKVNGIAVEDIGTHFNISAYPDETTTRTTVLEGMVKVLEVRLTPNQQLDYTNSDGHTEFLKNIDGENTVSWKNGMTIFKNAGIPKIMRVLSRWYDIRVAYEGKTPERSITGGVPRNTPFSEVLKMLELYKVNYKMDGNKITIMP